MKIDYDNYDSGIIMSPRLYNFLLLLLIYYEVTASANFIVTQAPGELNVYKGDNANISCNWTIMNAERIRVEWTKYHNTTTEKENRSVLSSLIWNIKNALTPTESSYNTTTHSISNNTARMTISSVTEEDVGLYVCEVFMEKPSYNNGKGNGTLIKVQEVQKNLTGPSQPSKYISLLGIICIFPVVVIVGYFLYRRRRRRRNNTIKQKKAREEEAALNQGNANNIDAEEDSNSSTDSVRWAVSMVYESVDYFAMKNPEDTTACSAGTSVENKFMDES